MKKSRILKGIFKKWKCKFCGGDSFCLMDSNLMMNFRSKDKELNMPYYYHYGDYDKGCRQRIPYHKIFKYARKVDDG